jgi:hypothetical protein
LPVSEVIRRSEVELKNTRRVQVLVAH